MKHFTNRKPKGRNVAWSRVVSHEGEVVAYRLFRRDHRRGMHMTTLACGRLMSRHEVARDLRRLWRELRDRVDEIDLAAMDEAA